ncbi:hypothetical protein [Effusibacillus dendaii]|uniref:Uncharacterized protein n=1 Tax=Effusibacillus dendaii TaxID=2743772 RepID=A0A7I8DGD2_9BACL|nr:hypothetical protein [Effusibacillus dendaii]BCJ88029.1 hypothetical protein skT53_30140 [Effusibacillus dendaii]
MKTLIQFFMVIVLLGGFVIPAKAEKNPVSDLKVDISRVTTDRDLVKRATLVVHGTPRGEVRAFPKRQIIPQGRVVNYLQAIRVNSVLKGKAPNTIQLVQQGLVPEPKVPDPLIKNYPGPLAEQDYIFFLQPIANTNFYSIVGVWQGLYPVNPLTNKTSALEREGFSSFEGLSIEGVKKRIQELRT